MCLNVKARLMIFWLAFSCLKYFPYNHIYLDSNHCFFCSVKRYPFHVNVSLYCRALITFYLIINNFCNYLVKAISFSRVKNGIQNPKSYICLAHIRSVLSVLCLWHLTKLGFLGHLGLMDNVAQDLLFLQQLVLVQCLLLVKVVVMLLLVLLQLIQGPLQGSTNILSEGGKI